MKEAKLVLEDGTVFVGKAFGDVGKTGGEVVFNTGMTGYQEVLTDPSYRGQIVTMTYPLIGNYGLNKEDVEASKPQVKGFVVKEFCQNPSNWRAKEKIDDYLKENGIVGIADIDTRALTKKLRQEGTMKGIIITEDLAKDELIEQAQQAKGVSGRDMVKEVTGDEIFRAGIDGEYRVVLIDCGAKRNIIRALVERDCEVVVVPADTPPEEIMAAKADGIVISNGPGDPREVKYLTKTIKELLDKKPMFGICLGHHLISQALGAEIYKLKFGHRGANHPVKDLATERVYITSQNHGFAVREDSLPEEVEVTHINVNDKTVEGISHKEYPVFSVQYHPEASPGPRDSKYLFKEFVNLL